MPSRAQLLMLAVTIVAVTLWYGAYRWEEGTRAAAARLWNSPAGAPPQLDEGALATLPEPVARYFRRVLPPGRPLPLEARLMQEGEFLVDGQWREIHAVEVLRAGASRGLVWDGRIRTYPLVSLRVRDTLFEGQGAMLGQFLGLFTVVDEAGRPEPAAAGLQRWLAEAAWLPPALLPGQGVTWRAVDGERAVATVSDHGVTAALEFRFDEGGEIVAVSTPGRYREEGGSYRLTPWQGRFGAYADRDGIRVPLEGEAAWLEGGTERPYFKLNVVGLSHWQAQ